MEKTLWGIVKASSEADQHSLSHVRRVHRLCMRLLAAHPTADKEIVTAAVILHDIARIDEDNDPSHIIDHALLGSEKAEEILLNLGWLPDRAKHVRDCIATHRFRNSGNAPQTIEAKLLFDADKLDSLGLIGVARVFMLSGQYGEELYVPLSPEQRKLEYAPMVHQFAQYAPNIEYYVKLRHIPERLFTDAAKQIANIRLAKMTAFFEGLASELGLEDIEELQ